MPNAFTPPNFHEDAPSSLETSLAGLVAAHSPAGALGMLIPEAQRRSQAQDDYHNTMATINQQQQQNLQFNRDELGLKTFTGLAQHAIPGVLDSARQAFGSIIPPANPELDQAIQQRSDASNVANLGKGNEGGIIPSASVTPHGFSVGPPQQVAAAGVRGSYDLEGRRIAAGAANKSFTEDKTTPDATRPWDTHTTRTYGTPPPASASPAASPTSAGPTPAMIDNKMKQLATSNSYGHKKVLEAAASNGGKPLLGPRKPDGSGTLMGADGIAY